MTELATGGIVTLRPDTMLFHDYVRPVPWPATPDEKEVHIALDPELMREIFERERERLARELTKVLGLGVRA